MSVSFLCLSCLRRTSAWYTLSSVVDILGHPSRRLSSVGVHCYWNILSYSCLFPHYMCWVHLHHLVLNSTGVVPLACSSSIILCTLTFDHIFSRTTCHYQTDGTEIQHTYGALLWLCDYRWSSCTHYFVKSWLDDAVSMRYAQWWILLI
jgi:hypothetical protein